MKSRTRSPILGGMFGLQEILRADGSNPPFLFVKDQDLFLANASSGIWLLIKLLSAPNIWMPSFLCGSMLDAVILTGRSVKFYEVNCDLVVPSLQWLDNVQQGDLVVLIDYFGFPCDFSCATRAKEQGAWVLEDACQALLSREVGWFSDFVLFSPRKFLGVADGGILSLNRDVYLHNIHLSSPPAEWWLKSLFAAIMRREFDIYGENRHWFELFQEAEDGAPIGPYAMSELSKMLLMHSFEYPIIAQRRVDNYQILLDELRDLALFPNLSSQAVPLGFPIQVEDRDQVRQVLFEHHIYPPVHWPIQGIVPEEFKDSHRLASEIMTLPCDQRYDRDDMHRMAQLVLKEVKQ